MLDVHRRWKPIVQSNAIPVATVQMLGVNECLVSLPFFPLGLSMEPGTKKQTISENISWPISVQMTGYFNCSLKWDEVKFIRLVQMAWIATTIKVNYRIACSNKLNCLLTTHELFFFLCGFMRKSTDSETNGRWPKKHLMSGFCPNGTKKIHLIAKMTGLMSSRLELSNVHLIAQMVWTNCRVKRFDLSTDVYRKKNRMFCDQKKKIGNSIARSNALSFGHRISVLRWTGAHGEKIHHFMCAFWQHNNIPAILFCTVVVTKPKHTKQKSTIFTLNVRWLSIFFFFFFFHFFFFLVSVYTILTDFSFFLFFSLLPFATILAALYVVASVWFRFPVCMTRECWLVIRLRACDMTMASIGGQRE